MIKIILIPFMLMLCSGCLGVSKNSSKNNEQADQSKAAFQVLKLNSPFDEIKANCILRSRERIWIGTDEGVHSFDPESLEHISHLLKGKKVSKLASAANQTIFARVDKKGLYSLPVGEGDFFSTGSSRIRDFVVDKKSNFVYCATSHGIDVYSNGSFRNIKVKGSGEFSRNANNVLKITQDQEGHFWLGTTFGLYKMISESNFDLFLADYQIIQAGSVINKSGNSPLVGNYFEDLKFIPKLNHLLISTNSGFSILKDPQNPNSRSSWVSYTGEHGKSMVSNGEVIERKIKGNSPLPNNYILNALQTKNSLYIGSEDGLAIFKNNKWSILNIDSEFLDDKIMDLYLFEKLDKNIIYVSTQSGVATIVEEKFVN
ncbi:MAG: hypothetical protein KC646_09780 [Candidatus Cloacimonetes bacterium]|nr:hypothetical protein [Candidatus Cloacimonadota bacterium]